MPNYPLGRRVRHDPRNKNYPFKAAHGAALVSVKHESHIAILDQGQLGSCHDGETEILTRAGWLPFPNLTMENELATVNPVTRELTYERPTRVIAKHYSGEMHSVSNSSKDFRVTADHSMLVRRWDEATRTLRPEYKLVPANELGWYSGLMTSVIFRGLKHDGTYTVPGIPGYKRASQREDLVVPMSTWLRFLGVYLAEGTMLNSYAGRQGNRIQIAAFKDREKTFVRAVLTELGVRTCELRDRFTFHSARIFRHMQDLGLKGVYASEKFVPEFVFDLSAEDISAFLQGHREGDGSLQNGTWSHYTSSPRLADDLQRLIFLAGGKSGISSRPPRSSVMKDGRVVVSKSPEYTVRHLAGTLSSIDRNKEVNVEQFDGMVYCAEVPTHHTLVTRRSGKILISGNCTGNATVGALGCDPYFPTETVTLDEAMAVKVYSLATTLDGDPDHYPPTDTGSDGQAAAKAAQQLAMISGYQHAFTLADALAALQTAPVITGIDWYDSFYTPSSAGQISIARGSRIDGGHEICADEYDATNQLVWFRNSWADDWGVKGRFCMTVSLWSQLLNQHGDVTVFTPLTAPAPTPTPTEDVDANMAAAFKAWRKGVVSKVTKSGKLATAGDAWLAKHGL